LSETDQLIFGCDKDSNFVLILFIQEVIFVTLLVVEISFFATWMFNLQYWYLADVCLILDPKCTLKVKQ